ncbi:uncharacterized protein TM35_000043360 [Trypanosoma theileri]|uniref:Uncharacterized protein n=1 Tax=Trypanosoma theileri TaxID=67003 RepID=A0A1X0P5B7_9TRYP|nr:uncharacterized protein TM35_000043360 [Trypanosoma theileri]ORC92122.1 hypothetical protein TM35_000043360 [Trypanosoma theileri]
MELDVVDENEVYTRAVQEAKWDILKGADVKVDWQQIQSRHPFFNDVVTDAGRQARQLASVMAATEFFIKQMLCCCENSWVSPKVDDEKKLKQWQGSLAVLLSLYASSSVPTRVRWEATVREHNSSSDAGIEPNLDFNGANIKEDEDEDDGSFVENQLKELISQCVAASRVWCRQLQNRGKSELAEKLRRAVSVMNAFVVPKTLEW